MSASVTGLCLCLCVYVYVYIIITTYIINILGTSDWLKIAARFAMESARKTNARSWAIDTDGSAAQPAPTIATYMDSGSAEQPAVQAPTHKLAFYNVGWQASRKKHNAAWLA